MKLNKFVIFIALLHVFLLSGCTDQVDKSDSPEIAAGAMDRDVLSMEAKEQTAKADWNITEKYGASGESTVVVSGYSVFAEGDFDPDPRFRAEDGTGYANNAEEPQGAYPPPDFSAVTKGEK